MRRPPISSLFPYTTLFRSRLVVHRAARVEMERGLGHGGQPSRPPARRLRLGNRFARPVVGRRVDVGQLRKAEALPDPAAKSRGDRFELGPHGLGPLRLANLALEPGVSLLPLAAGLVEARHWADYSAVQQPESGHSSPTSSRIRSPTS